MNAFDSDAAFDDDEQLIVRAYSLAVTEHERLRRSAVIGVVQAAARMAARARSYRSDSAPAEDEQHERDDGKNNEDRPQHDADSTPGFAPVHALITDFGGGTFLGVVDPDTASYPSGRVVVLPEPLFNLLNEAVGSGQRWDLRPPVTPEIQAVLDALPGYRSWMGQAWELGGGPDGAPWYVFRATVDAYLASIEPPTLRWEPEVGMRARIKSWPPSIRPEGVEIMHIIYPGPGRDWEPVAIGRSDTNNWVAWPVSEWEPC